MQKNLSHKHWFICQNKQWFDEYVFLICLADPRVWIKLKMDDSYDTGSNFFFSEVEEIQWLDGRPDNQTQILIIKQGFEFLFNEKKISNKYENFNVEDLIEEF